MKPLLWHGRVQTKARRTIKDCCVQLAGGGGGGVILDDLKIAVEMNAKGIASLDFAT